MEMTAFQADQLIGLKKKIIIDDTAKDAIEIEQTLPLNLRFELVSPDDDEFTFLWSIMQSAKDELRVSLHYQEDGSKIGLFRVDYNGGHKNPCVANEHLPEKFRPYIGKDFSHDESHVHYFVEGYKPLVWALPIADTELKDTNFGNADYSHNKVCDCIIAFAKAINIETHININQRLL